MKKIHRLTLALTLAVTVGLMPISACDISLSDELSIEYQYTDEQERIFECIEELGRLKAKAASVKEYLMSIGTDESLVCRVDSYSDIADEIREIREELVELGAKPSEEMLSMLELSDPISVNGVLIDDFEDFEYTFGEAYELWGVPLTVNASYGTFNTYEVLIQDYEGSDKLSTSVYQNGSLGYDIYSQKSSVASNAVGAIGEILFEKLYDTITNSLTEVDLLFKGAQILNSILSVDSSINSNCMITDNGLGHTYRIYCSAEPTVHFVYVQDADTKKWHHTLTTNRVSIDETHYFYISLSVGNGNLDHVSGEKDYSTMLVNDRYAYRVTDAITAFRNGLPRFDIVITSYSVYVENSSGSKEAFTLGISAPLDFNDLVRYGVERRCEPYIWLVVVIPVILAICSVCVWFIGKKKTKDKQI